MIIIGILFAEDRTKSPIIKLGGIDLTLDKNANKVRISNVANGVSDNDAVNYAQLKNATMHFVYWFHETNSNIENYNNKGATGKNAIAIGIKTKLCQILLHLGNGTEIGTGSDASIAIGTLKDGNKTKIENAKWSLAIGNKTNISKGMI